MNALTMPTNRGFTLVEIAIVMAIIGLLLGGLLVPLSAQVDAQRSSETQKAINEIREALMGFALANGRLPCPADPAIATGSVNAGMEDPTPMVTVCARELGVLPWVTLGVPETDAWGRRYTYRVTAIFADAIGTTFGCTPSTTPTQSSFALCSLGDITVTDGAVNIATDIPAVIVSHGKNGLGAYTSLGTQIAGATGNEQENADADTTFVNTSFTPTYDDQVAWISTNILMNRMVAAQKLP